MNPTLDLTTLRLQHLHWLQVRHYSPRTIEDRSIWLKAFVAWLERQGISTAPLIDRSTLVAYQSYWADHRKPDGQALAGHTQRARMVPAKTFCRWLVREGILLSDPAAGLEGLRVKPSLPKCILTHRQTEAILALPVVGRRNGLRDRAILEVLYSTGIRRQELTRLGREDVEWERGLLMIRQGKGGKDRLVPIGRGALHWVRLYLAKLQPGQGSKTETGPLFLSERGGALSPRHLTGVIGRYLRRAGKAGSCHVFRHTMATLMLEHGADIRHLQEMLGHASLQTTQIYTHVSVRRLKEVHERSHPAEIAYASQDPVSLRPK